MERTSLQAKTEPMRSKTKVPAGAGHKDRATDSSDRNLYENIRVIARSANLLLHCRKGFGRTFGLTASQCAVLAGLANRQGNTGISIKEIAEHVSLASTRVTTDVSRLENMGFLRKRINGGGRRGVLISLSTRGEKTFNRAIPLIRRTNALLFESIS